MHFLHPQKITMDTKHDGCLENVSSFKQSVILGTVSILDFGCAHVKLLARDLGPKFCKVLLNSSRIT